MPDKMILGIDPATRSGDIPLNKRAIVKCLICGKEVRRYASEMRKAKKGNFYCSTECYRNNLKGKNNPNWKNKTESRTCQQCGSQFFFLPESKRLNRGKFCSKKCLYDSLRGSGKIQSLPDDFVRELFEEFKRKNLSWDAFCFTKGISTHALKKTIKNRWPDGIGEAFDVHRACIDETYRRGRNFEYSVMRNLTQKGYWCHRSPASKGVADVVAIKKGVVLFVQCKSGNGKLEKRDRINLVNTATSIGAIPLLACKKDGRGITYFECAIDYREMKLWAE